MADRIYVTYTPTTAPGNYHTTIHYERTGPAGHVVEHVIIEAQPENLEKLTASDKAIGAVREVFRRDDGPSRFGRIDGYVQNQKPIFDPNAPYEIIAEEQANLRGLGCARYIQPFALANAATHLPLRAIASTVNPTLRKAFTVSSS